MLTNSHEMMKKAHQERFAIPAVDFIDLDMARVFVNVAEERGLPLILAFAQSHRHMISLEEAALIGRYLAEKVRVPISLHLDHGEDIDYIKRAIDLGFTSVMIDASEKPIDENIELTQRVMSLAKPKNITVEAELGHVGANDTSESSVLTDSIYTETEEVDKFVSETKVDMLAVSIGTAHGLYTGKPKISFDRLEEISNITDTPLVLHGGSSSGDDNLNRCAKSGISKINIYSDFLNEAYQAIIKEEPNNYPEMKSTANSAMRSVLNHYYDVFETKAI
ncbi:class II fructose-bisphosphate aldolase [Hutsoniella sourekii]|uniref:class II fructose-bisphosphate aldolase n=1 Tax=Hutsoniella sourekii TaxID=87650 RepID=UPI0004877BC8|nr:class II fructose-bisphosphate aldolase [Hutsoniella sourekii]